MKVLKLQNKEINPLYQVLDGLTVKSFKAKRGKAQIQKGLEAKNNEYNDDRTEIQKKFFEVDEDGKLISDDSGNLELKEDAKLPWVNKAVQELLDEEVGINLVEHNTKVRAFLNALENDEFEADDKLNDVMFDTLVTMIEEALEDKEEEK